MSDVLKTFKDIRIKAQLETRIPYEGNERTALMWSVMGVEDIIKTDPQAGKLYHEEILVARPNYAGVSIGILSHELARVQSVEDGVRSSGLPPEMYEVTQADMHDFDTTVDEYTYRDALILPGGGRYIVHYWGFPDYEMENIDETLQVPLLPRYRQALVYWLCFMIYGGEMHKTDQNTIYYSEMYNNAIGEAHAFYYDAGAQAWGQNRIPSARSLL